MMDQAIFNWAVGLAGFLGGWVLKVVWDAVRDLRKDIRQIERDLPDIYVRKDDFREAVREMKDTMRDGFNKMDGTMNVLFKKLDKKEDKE